MLPVSDGTTYALPAYDKDAFLIEAELLLDWYIPHRGVAVADAERAEFRRLWLDALKPALTGQQTCRAARLPFAEPASGCRTATDIAASACSISRTP